MYTFNYFNIIVFCNLFVLLLLSSLLFFFFLFIYNNFFFSPFFTDEYQDTVRSSLLFTVFFICLYSFYFVFYFYSSYGNFILNNTVSSIGGIEYLYAGLSFNLFNINLLYFSITNFSIIFLLLFSILFTIVFLLASYDYGYRLQHFYFYMYFSLLIIFLLLFVENIIFFFFLYEILVFLIFFLLYIDSNSSGGIEAAIFYGGWAILGSVFVACGILLILLGDNFLFNELSLVNFTSSELYYIYLLLFLGFGTNMSIWPFWYWLPKAHVEVSTGMSIFLSCILIKLAFFCLFSFQLSLNIEFGLNFFILLCLLSSLDIVFSFINISDLKALIAYSSVLHTNLLLVMVHLDGASVMAGSVLYIWGHSLATACMFLSVSLIEKSFGTSNLLQVSGMWYVLPNLSTLTFLSLLLFLELPITVFCWGEFWLWIVVLNSFTFVGIQILFLCNFIFIILFFKMWWGILFGSPDITILNSEEGDYTLIEHMVVFLLLLQFILGNQPMLLINGIGFF